MKLDLNSQPISFPCPGCKKKLTEKIGRLKRDPQLTCNGCGQTIKVNAAELRRGIESVQKSLNNLSASLRKLGK